MTTPSRRSFLLGGASFAGIAAAGSLGAASASANTSDLYSRLYAIDQAMLGTMSVAVHDARNGARWTYNGGWTNYCASIVKVLTLATVCYQAQLAGRLLNATEKAQATKMICNSDNDAATWLWRSVGGAPTIQAMANRLGMTHTYADPAHWGLSTTSAADQVLLLDEIFYRGSFINASKRSFIMQLMSAVESDQRWGVGSVGTSAVKNGWLQYASPYAWITNSVGHTTGGGRDYTIAILESMPSMSAGTSLANQIAAAVYASLATPL